MALASDEARTKEAFEPDPVAAENPRREPAPSLPALPRPVARRLLRQRGSTHRRTSRNGDPCATEAAQDTVRQHDKKEHASPNDDNPPFDENAECDPCDISEADPHASGLLCFKKWWFLREVGIFVHGELLTGTPIHIRGNTIRVVNKKNSYMIPLNKVDYIETSDGLDAACEHFDCCDR